MSSLIFRVAFNSSKNFTDKSSQKLFSFNKKSNIIRNVNNYSYSPINKSNTKSLLNSKNTNNKNFIFSPSSNILINNNKSSRFFSTYALKFNTSNNNEDKHSNSSEYEERSNYEEKRNFNILYASLIALGTTSFFVILSPENRSVLYSAPPSNTVTISNPSNNSTDISFSQSAAKLGSSEIVGEDVEIAPLWKRFFAFLIDNTIGGIIFQLTCTLFVGSLEYLIIPVSLLCNGIYEVLLTWQNDGQTLGKYVLGIQTVSSQTTYAVDGKQATLLFIYKLLLNVTFGLDVIWMLCNFTGERQALHNYLTDTIVVQQKKHK